MPVLANRVYVDGREHSRPRNLPETFEVLGATPGSFAYIALRAGEHAELVEAAEHFGLHELAVEDASHGHQRPKIERYGDTLFVVLHPATYQDDREKVVFGELHVFVGKNFVLAVAHEDSSGIGLESARFQRLQERPALLALGPDALLYGLFDAIVDGFKPIADGLETDIDEIEEQLFAGEESPSRRIYELFNEVVDVQRATRPLVDMLDDLARGADKYEMPTELRRRYRDVKDHVLRIVDRTDTFRAQLQNALTVAATIVNQNQNEAMKRISSWAAILFAPTLIGSIYGMNFANMPELDWPLGYPLSLLAMVLFGAGLWTVFKFKKWL